MVPQLQAFVVQSRLNRLFMLFFAVSLLLASGCTVALSPLLTKTEKLFNAGKYEELSQYLQSDEGKLSERERHRILNENINKIRTHRATTFELIYYQYDFRRLVEALIELDQLDKALAICNQGLKERRMLAELFHQSRYDLKTSIELNNDTIEYLTRLKAYITWFKTGDEKETLKYFYQSLPVGAAQRNSTISFFDFSEKHRLAMLFETGLFYDKILGRYRESLNYFEELMSLAQKLSLFDIDGKYFYTLMGYKRMMNLYVKLGKLEEAKKTLDKYNETTDNLVFNTGHLLTSNMEMFRGLVSVFDSNAGAMFALSRDFDNSKKYFDKSFRIVDGIGSESQHMWDQKAWASYYVLYGAYYLGLQNKLKEAVENVDIGLTHLRSYYLSTTMDELDIESAYIYSAELHYLNGNYDKALERARKAVDFAYRYFNYVSASSAYVLEGEIYLKQKELNKAKQVYEEALRLSRNMESTENWRLFYGLGCVYEGLDQRERALQFYKDAVTEVEKLWEGRFKDTKKQVSFIDNRLVVFEPMIRLLHLQGKNAEAVYYMDRSKARTFFETSPYHSSEEAFYKRNGDLEGHTVATARKVIESLPDDRAILEYYVGEHSVTAAVITKKRVHIEELSKTTPERLHEDVIALKLAIESRKYPYEERASALYSILVEPLTKYLRGYRSICIIPHGVLHYLPFHALIIDEKKPSYLIDEYQISYAPSLSILNIALHRGNGTGKDSLLAIGNSLEVDIKDLGLRENKLGKLRFVKDEIDGVGALFNDGDKSVFMDETATKTTAIKEAHRFDIILFSTHGVLLEKEPLKSCIFLHKDSEGDGRLTVADIEKMNLKANIVVLSACQSGLVAGYEGISKDNNLYNTNFPHGDDLVGLQRAFMGAGASSVLSTLWTVNDEATKSLIIDFFGHYKNGADKVSALQAAQLTIKSHKEREHPYYWASFVLSGDWR